MVFESIESDRLLLRPIDYDDTSLIVKWRNSPFVRCNFVFHDDFSAEMHEKWMKTKVETGEVIQYIIVEKATKTPIGSVYFRDIDSYNNSAEFGIFIGEQCAMGKGYGSEVTKMFTYFGLKTIGLHRIMLRVFSDNIIAQKAYLKAGYSVEGEFKDMVNYDGKYRSMVFMSVINDGDN